MVGIIIVGDIELSPFSKKYTKEMEAKNIPYEIIHWNRSGKENPEDNSRLTHFEQVNRFGSLISKARPFFNFRSFAKKAIKEKKYDKLIILTTQTAVILADVVLSRKYKNKYFFDYRDPSYEYIRLYRMLINKIIINSYATSVSSPGFLKYLTDKKELIMSHNFQDKFYDERLFKCSPRKEEGKVIVGCIGYLRQLEFLEKLSDIFGKDERFEFHIYGSGDCEDELREYAKQYENVHVFGGYLEKDKMEIVDSFDMICYYFLDNFVNTPGIANRFYDGVIRKKPLFGSSRIYAGELIEKKGLGISLDEDDPGLTDKLFDYYENFDREQFEKNCEDYLETVMEDEKRFTDAIKEFLDS